jgi:hypothetical protein
LLKPSRQDVAAPVLSGVASRRRTLAAVLAGTITLLTGVFRQDTDARDKRKPGMGRRRGHARNERLLSAREPGRHNPGVTVSRSPVRSAVGNRDQALLVDRRKSPLARIMAPSEPDADTAPRQPNKRKRRERQHKQERERHHATRKTSKENVSKKNKRGPNDLTISTPSDDATRNEEIRASTPTGSNTKTLLWTKLYPTTLTETNLQRIAFSRFNGFQIDNSLHGQFDDFRNGGVTRLPPGEYKQLVETISNAATSSRELGMDRLFIRLNSADIDVYAQEDVDTMIRSTRAQAAFALQTGLAGIWLDAEDYEERNIWVQEQDPGKRAYGRPAEEVQEQYRAAGQQFVQAIMAEYPEAEILLAPSLHLSAVWESCRHLPDFYNGMASVNNHMGIVITTEMSYSYSSEDELSAVVSDEEHYLADNSSVALGYWPKDETAETMDALAEAVRIGRQYSGKYTWVYDEDGIFVQDSPHSCLWEGWSPGHACLAKPLQDVLPPL